MLEEDVAEVLAESAQEQSTRLDDSPVHAAEDVDVAEQLRVPRVADPPLLLEICPAGSCQRRAHFESGFGPGRLFVLLPGAGCSGRESLRNVLLCGPIIFFPGDRGLPGEIWTVR